MITGLSGHELDLVLKALDALKYELADQKYRWSGFVLDPGSDDPEVAEQIQEIAALESKLGG